MEIATAFVTIRPETAGFEAELAAAVGGQSVDVPVTADVGDAEAAVEGLSGSDVEVGVEADTSDAEGAIEGIEAPPIEAEVQVDTSGAEEQIGGLGDSLSGLVGGGGEATGALDAFSGAALGAGSAGSIAATGGLAAVAAGLGYAVSEGAEAQVTLGQLEAMVANLGNNAGVTSGGLQALATDLQQTAGFSDEAVMSGESMVLMFENVRNTADQPIFDRAIRSAADLARSPFGNGDISASARTLGRALEDPTASFGRLARQGITFSAAQEQAITSMQAAGDVAGAQAVLLDAVDAKVGGLAQQYGGTFTGSVDRAKEAVGEMAESLGTSLLPALELVSESVIDQIARLQSWDDALNGALLSGPLQAIMGVGDAIDAQGAVVGDLPPALGAATSATEDFATAQDAAAQAVAGTLPSLGDIIGQADRAGQAFGILNASSDPQVIIDNLGLALFAWDDFQANISTVSQWGPNIAAALQQLGPQVAGGLTSALAEGNAATIVQLDGLIAEIQARGGDASAVLTGFAQTGMDGAVAAVNAATGPMGAAGTAAGASGAAGIDAGLAFSNASGIGQIVGVQYGAGVSSGITAMAGTVAAVAANLFAGVSISSAFSRGQSLGSAYGSGVVAGLAGQIGNAAATRASLDAIVESSTGGGLTRTTSTAPIGGSRQPIQVVLPGVGVIAEAQFDYDRRVAIAEGYEQP